MAVVFVIKEDKAIGFNLYPDAYDDGEAENNPNLQDQHAHFTRV